MFESKICTWVGCLALTVLLALPAAAQEKKLKSGLTEEDWAYTLHKDVEATTTTFYSDGTACFAKMFYPKNHGPDTKTPAVVLAHGWTGTHTSMEKYGAKFAEYGLVAMVIDYRGWGKSDGFVSMVGRVETEDPTRFTEADTAIQIKRTRLIPLKQVEDIRNAISYLQGEPGVDPDRIGIWGSSFAGGNTMTVASMDSRVKAVVAQVPAIGGKDAPRGPLDLPERLRNDAIKRAREGQAGEFRTGFSAPRMVDVETQQKVAEYRPFHRVQDVPDIPVLFIVAENEELFNNQNHAYAAAKVLKGESKVIEVKGVTHFEMYVGEGFEQSSSAAGAWFAEHLGAGGSE